MNMMIISAAVLLVVLTYCASRSFGAEPAPVVSELMVTAGPIGARVSLVLYPKLALANVWICYGTEDAGDSVIEWQHMDGHMRIEGGAHNLPMGPLEPDTRYCVRVMAENGGGQTWSEPVWVRTGELRRLDAKQVGTVVVIK
jgi:hypothetical protein